jgi:O-antigen ligase
MTYVSTGAQENAICRPPSRVSRLARAAALPREAVNAKLIGLVTAAAVSLGVFLSGFVISEPAPYELFMSGLIAVWALFGLRISRGVAPLLVLLVLFNIGGMIAMTQMTDLKQTPLYLAVSLFLAFTAVFFAAVIEARPDLYKLVFGAWLAAAVSTAFFGILGYFHAFPGAEAFTRYGRAAGVFEDPNVFGPFLALPGVYMIHRLVTGNALKMPLFALALLVIAAGIFFSFSRGAWGLFAVSAMLLIAALFIRSSSAAFRLRIIVMSAVAIAILALGIVVALQIPGVAEVFSSRAQLVQEYDGARLGRFARYAIGFMMALEHPLGIGPLAFGYIFGEDTHNIWLKALMDYGWLGFAAWLIMILWTLAGGFRILFRDRPWQPYLLSAYVVLVGHVGLGTVIDTDHWRHFYILIGLVWGAMALERKHQLSLRSATAKRTAPQMRGKPIAA